MAILAAAVSDIGPANIIPSTPKKNGKKMISGAKKTILRVTEVIMPSLALPVEVKNPEDIGCSPFIKIINIKIRK